MRGSIQASAGSSRRERGVAGLNLEVGHVHLGGGAIGPAHRRHHHWAVGGDRCDGGHGAPREGSAAGGGGGLGGVETTADHQNLQKVFFLRSHGDD